MARFDKLEFNVPRQPEPETPRDPCTRDAEHWLAEADKFRRVGLYEGALRYYSRALEMEHSLVTGWVGQVQMLVLLDEFPEAELWSRKGLELFPNNGELMAARAQAYCRMTDMKQAHAHSDGSMQQPGQSAYRWQVRGEIMVATKQNTDQFCFDKSQQIDPDWIVPLETARIYLYYGKPSKALARIRKAVEMGPDAHFVWYVQGLCQFELGLTKAARESYQHCLDLCPRHADALRELARTQGLSWSPLKWVRRLLRRS